MRIRSPQLVKRVRRIGLAVGGIVLTAAIVFLPFPSSAVGIAAGWAVPEWLEREYKAATRVAFSRLLIGAVVAVAVLATASGIGARPGLLPVVQARFAESARTLDGAYSYVGSEEGTTYLLRCGDGGLLRVQTANLIGLVDVHVVSSGLTITIWDSVTTNQPLRLGFVQVCQ
jgi:hypothetical protein